jgi:hypothetical protein
MDPIVFTDRVAIEFHRGAARGVWWATLHIGPQAVEIGTVRGEADIDSVLTMAAGVIMERDTWADDTWVSSDGSERWVLIGTWLLNARMTPHPHHVRYGTEELAREMFLRLREAQL